MVGKNTAAFGFMTFQRPTVHSYKFRPELPNIDNQRRKYMDVFSLYKFILISYDGAQAAHISISKKSCRVDRLQ